MTWSTSAWTRYPNRVLKEPTDAVVRLTTIACGYCSYCRAGCHAQCDHANPAETYPIGQAVNKNLTLRMGDCHHRRYLPLLVDYVRTGRVQPTEILAHALRHFGKELEVLDAVGRIGLGRLVFSRDDFALSKMNRSGSTPGSGYAFSAE